MAQKGFCPKWNTQWIGILNCPFPTQEGEVGIRGGAEEVDRKDWRCPGGLPRGGKHPSEEVSRDCVCGMS